MRILQVASEAYPLVKTGGLADVSTALSQALRNDGDDVRLLLPAYRGCAEQANATLLCDLGDPLGVGPARLLEGTLPDHDVIVWLVDCPNLYDRAGGPYLDSTGHDWFDNYLRFGLLCRVAAQLGIAGALLGWAPDIIHGHDWQAGLAMAHLSVMGGNRPATVFTIHNLNFHGLFEDTYVEALGLPRFTQNLAGMEFFGKASFLKAGIFYADQLTTVSPTYAQEIQTSELGEGLHGLLAHRSADLHGILNGIDETRWDPQTDPALRRNYGVETLADKRENKLSLQVELGLARNPDVPVIGSVGRLTGQKGVDLLLGVIPQAIERNAQVAIIGSGEPSLEAAVEAVAEAHPGRVAFFRGYSETLSHRLIAGASMLVVPSRFEPCGLTQLYAMRYGTVPIVRATGGLKDTVIDAREEVATGYTFEHATVESLADAVHRALNTYYERPGTWEAIQRRGMTKPMGWQQSAVAYRALYRRAVSHGRRALPRPYGF